MAISTATAQGILSGAAKPRPATPTAAPAPTPTAAPRVTDLSAEIGITSCRLTNTMGGHSKYYTVMFSDLGHVIFNWGRIGASNGQWKIEKLPTGSNAEAVGMKQVYAKASKGYDRVEGEQNFRFTATVADLDHAVEINHGQRLDQRRRQAMQNPQFAGQQQTATAHYDTFITAANALMTRAATENVEEVLDDWAALQAAWAELDDKHGTAAATVSLTGQMLQQRLLSQA